MGLLFKKNHGIKIKKNTCEFLIKLFDKAFNNKKAKIII